MNLTSKKIVVFGLGVSGMGALRFLKGKEATLWAINQGEPSSWGDFSEVSSIVSSKNCLGEDSSSAKKICFEADLIILSPGIPRDHEVLKDCKAPIWSEIELASHFSKAPIIAVTGTNGKTTTISFLDHLLKSLGKRVFTGGNIGVAFCDHIRSGEVVDYILLELSSFQLESTFDFKPDVGVLLNVFPNHGERYEKNEDYAKAKFNINKMMGPGETLIFDSGNEVISKWGNQFTGKKIAIETDKPTQIEKQVRSLFNLDQFKLPGMHNKINLDFCLKILNSLNLLEDHKETIQKGIDSFKGVAHRIEYVPCSLGFEVYNDAKSTNWDATMTALSSMDDFDKDLILILGGKLRGHNDEPPLKAESFFKNKVKKVLLIGESADFLEKKLSDWVPCLNIGTLDKAAALLKNEIFSGIVLLSPAFPSFDQYKSYVERGNSFKKLFN
jgi:UDP-N-acetylmuramoylalanine--D-glutamate ligase